MKKSKIILTISIILSLSLSNCRYEKDPGIFAFNGTIQGTVVDKETRDSIPGARLKIWFNNESFDPVILYTDNKGYYVSEKLNINSDFTIKVEASKEPDYEVTTFNGRDFSAVNTPGEISGGAQADTWIINFGLSSVVIAYQVIPDTLFYTIKYEDPDPSEFSWQQLTILNKGTKLLNWDLDSPEHWIYFDPVTSTSGRVLEKEFKILKIGVNRTILLPGNYTGSVDLTINGELKSIPVIAIVY